MWEKLSEASNTFAISLYKKLSENDGNLIFSPFSLSAALGMLYFGVRGNSSTEMENVMGYDAVKISKEEVHENFQKILQCLANLPDDCLLEIANSVLIQKDFPIHPEYVEGLKFYYDTEAKNVDFKKENEKVKAAVNSWVKEKTKGKVENLLEFIDSTTSLLLLNAVYFKGLWETPFSSQDTHPVEFYNFGKNLLKKSVDMMNLSDHSFQYADLKDEGFSVLELPYRGGHFSMWVLLPNKMDGLSNMENKLSVDLLRRIESSLVKTKFNKLSLPKFKLEDRKELSSVLQQMGMPGIFTQYELTGIGDNLVVKQVIHKATVEINEEGSEASAATAVLIAPGCSLFTAFVEFIVDHPFLFLIINKTNGMIMFSGRVNEL